MVWKELAKADMTELLQAGETVNVVQTAALQPEDQSSDPGLVSGGLPDLEQVSKPLGASVSVFMNEMLREY